MTTGNQTQTVSGRGGVGLSLLLAIGGGLYGYGQNEFVGAGIGVIVGALTGFAIGMFLIVVILALVAWVASK